MVAKSAARRPAFPLEYPHQFNIQVPLFVQTKLFPIIGQGIRRYAQWECDKLPHHFVSSHARVCANGAMSHVRIERALAEDRELLL
jgi:hypothetical protein